MVRDSGMKREQRVRLQATVNEKFQVKRTRFCFEIYMLLHLLLIFYRMYEVSHVWCITYKTTKCFKLESTNVESLWAALTLDTENYEKITHFRVRA